MCAQYLSTPSITERGTTYLMFEAKLCRGKCPTTSAPYGSITYDCEKGRMPLEWENEDKLMNSTDYCCAAHGAARRNSMLTFGRRC